MKLTVNNIRGINETFEFNNLNVLSGTNGSGKSTIINLVRDMLRGKTDIDKGSAMLNRGDMNINIQSGRIFESPHIDMDLATPGFLMGKGKLVQGVNKSMDDRRQTISRFLKIDRDGFFQNEGVTSDISGLTSKLKTLKTEESVLTQELMEKEGSRLSEIIKPIEVKLIPGTTGNEGELNRLKERLASIKLEPVLVELPKPELIELDTGNIETFNQLKQELEDIKKQGSNIPESCDKCGQAIHDAEKMKEALRKQYSNIVRRIKAFDLKESNKDLYDQARSDLELYNNRLTQIRNIESNNIDKENEIKSIEKQIKDFKLVETTKGNEEEYEQYQIELSNFNSNESIKQSIEGDINKLRDKIKAVPTIDIELQIKKYKQTELKFVDSLKDKLIVGDMEFIFYRELKSPNTNGESFTPTFEVTYLGKNYNECSGGEQGMIDVMIAYLFLEDRPLLIDNAEISTEALQKFIENYCKDTEVIITRISKDDLKLTHTL